MQRALCILASFLCAVSFAAFARAEETKLSGPYTKGNLTVYLIHGQSAIKGDYLTLEEALAQKKAIVHETGDVNELAIENKSKETIYVQAGDIVKGGKQDRTLGTDIVLAPGSGKTPIASFCVEHGRWTQRGGESASLFESSSGFIAGKKMKLAGNNNYANGGGQQKVWDEAALNQSKLSSNLGTDVATAAASPSSFQLTLENEDVKMATGGYVDALKAAPNDKADVIGYAIAINGKLNCADVYGSSALFLKLWPRLLYSAAVEAAAEAKPDQKFEAPSLEQVRIALKEAEQGKPQEKQVTDRVTVFTCETHKAVMFETRDKNAAASFLHRNYLTKED